MIVMASTRDRVLAVLRHEEIDVAPLDAPGVHQEVITTGGETVENFQRHMDDAGVKSLFGQPRLEPYLARSFSPMKSTTPNTSPGWTLP